MGRPKENVLGKSYTNRWLFTFALQREEIYIANNPGARNMKR
jgi:hypothetical protein